MHRIEARQSENAFSVPSTSIFLPDIFKGRVLFCTGGGSGICRSMTEAIMKHGANAVIVGRTLERITKAAEELQQSSGNKCIATQADVRNVEQLKAAVRKTIEIFGRIDFVICGAAGNFLAPVSGLSENAFRTVLEIDTIGTFNTVKATIPHIRKTKGSYIHVSATLHYRGTPFQAHVSAAKAGVDAFSAVLAVEEGPRGVRSNVIAPGPIGETEGMERLSPTTPGALEIIRRAIPLGRLGDKRDVANAAVYLFSDAAMFVSGTVIVVDGASEHIRPPQLPYPESVLDPEGARKLIKQRL
ncbi:2,4-dienoyl- reductase [Pyrrhoderma noxium]|uniref:2,4-dienoyl-CoA reductase [(3E)-enoyl-CoA-producing] n=1 Tax=Pyrrhoderma noxium TaxID=2282107 RepID=A0A286UQ36_9AGAM|nr:2,4-dienoyl- reductase [Pyrrhoderma noxium]